VPILGTVVALWTGGALANRPGGRTPPTTGRPSGARPARAERSSPHDVGDGLATRCADDHGGSSGSTSPRHLEVGRRALERIGYPWEERLAGWTVTFLPGRAGLLGGTWTYERRIEIYVRANQSVEDVAFTLAHELGHAVDVTHFGEDERRAWLAARGLDPDTRWWVESGATDFGSGAGDWAEAFAMHLLGGAGHSRLAGQPDAAQLDLVARLAGP
jgi:hypothetical protein